MTGIARFTVTALDCPDPQVMAEFYSRLTGWPIARDEDDWYELAADGAVTLAFQLAPDNRPPVWPSADEPQQVHLDFDVDDLDEGERQVLAIGARKAAAHPGETFRVYLDPAGHPFCLVLASRPAPGGNTTA